MKSFKCVSSLFFLLASILYWPDSLAMKIVGKGAKKPVATKEIRGAMPYRYAIVHTTIQMDPQKRGTSEEKPIIKRTVKGYIGGMGINKPISSRVDVELKIPEPKIEIDASKVTGAVAKIAGACDPKAGVVAQAASVIIDSGLQILGDELTEFYKQDPFTLSIVELIPTKYYTINEDTTGAGSIALTDDFKKDLEKYNGLIAKLKKVVPTYNNAVKKYKKEYDAFKQEDPLMQNEETLEYLNNLHDKEVRPAVEKVIEYSEPLKNYPLYRMAIMAVNMPEGDACKDGGAGSGPYALNAFIYRGAKQVNVYEIDYCVPDKKKTQNFILELLPLEPDLKKYRPEGFRLLKTQDNTISFPITLGPERTDYSSERSGFYDFWTEMITSEKEGLENFMFPFDIYKMRQGYEKMAQEKEDEQTDEQLNLLDQAIGVLNKNKGEITKPSSEQTKVKIPQLEDLKK